VYIGVDFGDKGEHILRFQGMDPFGNARVDQTLKIIRSGEIASIKLKSAAGNVADGKTPVKMQLELLDSDGRIIPAEIDLEISPGTLKPLKLPGAASDASSGKGTDADKTNSDKAERLHVDAAGTHFSSRLIRAACTEHPSAGAR
jgi:hypothetical protein